MRPEQVETMLLYCLFYGGMPEDSRIQRLPDFASTAGSNNRALTIADDRGVDFLIRA